MATELILVEVELPFGGIPTVKDPCFAPIRVFLERISWIWRNEESVVVVLELDRVAAQLIECCDGRLETQLAEFHSSTASLFSFPLPFLSFFSFPLLLACFLPFPLHAPPLRLAMCHRRRQPYYCTV